MTRFSRAGRNWEGRSFVVNPAVASLADLVERYWPERHGADGTVASKQHDANNPTSDHRPFPFNGAGVVYAIDVGEVTEDDGIVLAEALRSSRDPRIKYVIHESRLFASYKTASRPPWAWGPYTGYNPHTNHVHVSVNRDAGSGEWNLDLGGDLEHQHTPMPSELPRDWGTATWAQWVERSNTDDSSRGWTFYREDLGWVYSRVIRPLENRVSDLERELSTQAAEIRGLSARLASLENQQTQGGIPWGSTVRLTKP